MTLGERMKEYEFQSRTKLLRRLPVIIRLDGCHFHTFTKELDKPYDFHLAQIMQLVTKDLCQQVQGCVLGYTQSDEITLVLFDYKNQNSDAWYDNQVQKICSVAAAIASVSFNKYLNEYIDELETDAIFWQEEKNFKYSDFCYEKADLLRKKKWEAIFDARAFNVPKHEVINNLIWRQQDAIRNSINAVGQQLFSQVELQGVCANQLKNMISDRKEIDFDKAYPSFFRRGSTVIKKQGKWIIDDQLPLFTEDRDYVNNLVLIEQ